MGEIARPKRRRTVESKKIWERPSKAKRWAALLLFFLGVRGVPFQVVALEAQEVQEPREILPRETSPRRPVLLVPGWLERSEDLNALRERFIRDGWSEDEILTIEFEDPVGSNVQHARDLAQALQELRGRSGAPSVDVVAHSMGGLAVWVMLQEAGDRLPVRRVVFLGSPLQGTMTAFLAWGEGGREMRPGSEFLEGLLSGGQPQDWAEVLTIRTPVDLNVLPGKGGTLPGMRDRLICCPTHQGLMDHEPTFQIVKAFLLQGVVLRG
jgi:triacylglycerol lipase